MADTVTAHFVTFFSPGTFVHEESTNPIESWDTERAVELAQTIKERHGARPFAFRFSTRTRGPKDLDSSVTAESPTYYLGGRVLTLDDVKRETPESSILIENMESNGYARVVVNGNSYRSVHLLCDGDVVLPVSLRQETLP